MIGKFLMICAFLTFCNAHEVSTTVKPKEPLFANADLEISTSGDILSVKLKNATVSFVIDVDLPEDHKLDLDNLATYLNNRVCVQEASMLKEKGQGQNDYEMALTYRCRQPFMIPEMLIEVAQYVIFGAGIVIFLALVFLSVGACSAGDGEGVWRPVPRTRRIIIRAKPTGISQASGKAKLSEVIEVKVIPAKVKVSAKAKASENQGTKSDENPRK